MGHMACTLHGVVDPAFLPDTTDGHRTGDGAAGRRAAHVADRRRHRRVRDLQRPGRRPCSRACRTHRWPRRCCRWASSARTRCRSCRARSCSTATRTCATTSSGRTASIDRPQPPRDEQRLRPTIEWMLAGLPWMCADELAGHRRPAARARARRARRRNVDDRARRRRRPRRSSTEGDDPAAAASRPGTDHDFVIWGTKRASVARPREDRRRRRLRGARPRRDQHHLTRRRPTPPRPGRGPRAWRGRARGRLPRTSTCGSTPTPWDAMPTLNVGTSPLASHVSSKRRATCSQSPSCAWRRTRNSSPP